MPLGFIAKKCSQFKMWFIKLGFWKKLIIIFTINTFIILLIMNVLMQILFNQVNFNISDISVNQTNQYISISNNLVTVSQANSLLTGVELYADFLTQIDGSIHFFRNRTNLLLSKQSDAPPYNPQLASQYQQSTPDFRKTVIYKFNQNSTFQDQPYLDTLMSSMFGIVQQKQIKRLSVIYQSLTNPSDIFARTVPATNDFRIPSVEEVNNRMANLTRDYISATGLYLDAYTSKPNPQKLFGLRTVEQLGNFRFLMQIEIYQQTLTYFMQKLFYVPSTQIMFFRILSQNPPSYQLINVDSFQVDLTPCFQHGVHQINLPNGTVLTTYSIAINESFYISSHPFILSHEQIMSMNSTVGSFRMVLLVNKVALSSPNTFMSSFLSNQSKILNYIIYGWSFVILLATIGLSIVTGNYIFYNLKKLSQKLEQYTLTPSKIHKIIFQLKQLQCRGVVKKLIDNVVSVIQNIEEKKKNKNILKVPISYPLNLAEKQFAIKHNLGDEQKWEQFKNMLIETRNDSLKPKSSSAHKILSKDKNKEKNS